MIALPSSSKDGFDSPCPIIFSLNNLQVNVARCCCSLTDTSQPRASCFAICLITENEIQIFSLCLKATAVRGVLSFFFVLKLIASRPVAHLIVRVNITLYHAPAADGRQQQR